jgi:hypothetical protein
MNKSQLDLNNYKSLIKVINNDYKLLMEEIDINTEYNSVDIIDKLLDYKKELLYLKFINIPIDIQYKIITFLTNEYFDVDNYIIFIFKIYDNYIPTDILILILHNLYAYERIIILKYSKYLSFKDCQKLLYHDIYLYNFINIENIELRKQVKELYEFLIM